MYHRANYIVCTMLGICIENSVVCTADVMNSHIIIIMNNMTIY